MLGWNLLGTLGIFLFLRVFPSVFYQRKYLKMTIIRTTTTIIITIITIIIMINNNVGIILKDVH